MKVLLKHKTAVLIFAHSSEEEITHKRIKKGRLLFQTLNQHTLQTVKDTGLPFFHFTEKQQQGLSFGERFSNAIQCVFNQGYERIITVGNDSPHLTEALITTAAGTLNKYKLVLGPSADGGFYLMGLHKVDFKKEYFEKLSWQTAAISSEVLCLLSPNSDTHQLLPQLFDIDNHKDVSLISSNVLGLKSTIRKLILAIVCENIKPVVPKFFKHTINAYCIQFNKGSPLISFS